MDIFGLNLQELYLSLMVAIIAFIIALLATWLSNRSDKSSCGKRSNKQRKKTLR